MSHSATRTRLDLTPLDDRATPSNVTSTTTARPFDFVGTGTLTTTDHSSSGGTALTDTATNSVTVTGTINYTNSTDGKTGTVTLTGTGTGNEVSTSTTDTGGRGAYAQTTLGQLAFSDANGTVSSSTPYTATNNWSAVSGSTGSLLVGPVPLTGTFDTSTFQLDAGWNTTSGTDTSSQGSLTVTLANKTSQPTTFSFASQAASLESDGSVDLNFTAVVTGQLMTADSRSAPETYVTAEWQGGGQTEAADIKVPVHWNTGTVSVNATGLTPPSWAKTLVVQIDAGHKISGADGTNGTWTVDLSGLSQPTSPPPTDGGPTSPPPTDNPSSPPPPNVFTPIPPGSVPVTPASVPTSFSLITGPNVLVQWRNISNQVIAEIPAFDSFSGPATISTADVNGDGVLDVAVAAGEGGGPRVRVFDGKTGYTLADFFAFDSDFRGGVNIAVGDVLGTGANQIVAGAGVGGGPQVRIFDAQTGQLENSFFAYDPSSRGGVNVAAADLTGGGVSSIITGAGVGNAPVVNVFDGASGANLFSVLAGPSDSQTGVKVAVTPDTSSKGVLLTATAADTNAALARFHSQLMADGPLLVDVSIPMAVA